MSADQNDEEEEDEEVDEETLKREALIDEQRTKQLEQIEAVIPPLKKKVKELSDQNRRLALLESVSGGLYDELDKLAKKAAADEITDLAVEQVNDVLRETKELIANDSYIQRYKEFVPAGNNPQYRDVVMMLRQLWQGLTRFSDELSNERTRVAQLLTNARGIRVALTIFLEEKDHPVKGDLEYNDEDASAEWFESGSRFSFYKLNRTNISEHFAVAS